MSELSSEDRAMLGAYAEFVQRIWSDEEFAARAVDEPRAALVESGWELPESTEVVLLTFDPAEIDATGGDPSALAAGWRAGVEAGKVTVVIPSGPPVSEASTLSDEELANAAGGWGTCGPGYDLGQYDGKSCFQPPMPPDPSQICQAFG
jgi:hypothetical protein